MATPITYVVTDIEADGPDPGVHSMLSWASVAQSASGEDLGHYAANLFPLDGAKADSGTIAWWQTEPKAWAAVTRDQIVPSAAIESFVAWVRCLPGVPVFVAHPLSFDGAWIDWYLQHFANVRLFYRPRAPGLFFGSGIDLPSLVMGTTGWSYELCDREHYPEEWLGGYAHSHCALDDARGYASLLRAMLTKEAKRLWRS